ncbi:MAG: hypothetical protein HOW73_47545 [Polyangiaceae bacterium]|nr:hypothetical protein [Polyangiaceae bacterium]
MTLDEILEQREATRTGADVRIGDFIGGIPEALAEQTVLFRALTTGEIAASTEAAVRFRNGVLSNVGEAGAHLVDDPALLENEAAVQRVWRAVRDIADPSRPALSSADFLRNHLLAEEVAIAVDLQDEEQLARGAAFNLSDDERDELLDAIAEHGDAAADARSRLEHLPRRVLVGIILELLVQG